MGTLQGILTLLRFLPDFIDLAKRVGDAIEGGVDYLRVQEAMKKIDKAFLHSKPEDRARSLNDIFRKG